MVVVPITRDEANAFIGAHHRHLGHVAGHLFAIAAAVENHIVAVATVGRPKARLNQDGLTCELTRLASDGTPNACSFLYRRAWRAAQAMGFHRMLTYTLPQESGASLRAAGFKLLGQRGGGSWSRSHRPRVDTHPLQPKLAWELISHTKTGVREFESEPSVGSPGDSMGPKRGRRGSGGPRDPLKQAGIDI